MAAPNSSPELCIVDGGETDDSSPRPESRRERLRDRLEFIPRIVLLGLLVLALVVALQQFQRADLLAARVAVLETELESSGAELAARRVHLGAVQGAVADLEESLRGLVDVANRDPVSGANSAARPPR